MTVFREPDPGRATPKNPAVGPMSVTYPPPTSDRGKSVEHVPNTTGKRVGGDSD